MTGKSAAFANYKEGTGVRARSDLSPNPRIDAGAPFDHDGPISDDELALYVETLGGYCRAQEKVGVGSVTLPLRSVRRLERLAMELVDRRAREISQERAHGR